MTRDDHADLRQKLAALRRGEVPAEELYGCIHDFGEARLFEAEDDVVALLNHESDQIRYIAISVLTLHWDMRKHKDKILERLFNDPDDDVRAMAAAGLGAIFEESQDPQITRALLTKLRDEEETPRVRESAYGGLLDVWLPVHVREKQKLSEIKSVLAASRARSQDLEKARGAREAIDQTIWMWEQDWDASIDWSLVSDIEKGRFPRTGSTSSD